MVSHVFGAWSSYKSTSPVTPWLKKVKRSWRGMRHLSVRKAPLYHETEARVGIFVRIAPLLGCQFHPAPANGADAFASRHLGVFTRSIRTLWQSQAYAHRHCRLRARRGRAL